MAWTMTTLAFSDISEVKNTNLGLEEEEIVRIKVSFAYSGNALFYTYGDGDDDAGHAYDPCGYLCLSAEDINKTSGEPDGDIEVEDDDSGDGYNFRIECYVEAQKAYYLYVRHRAASSYGTIHLTIEPPDEPEVYEPNMDDIYIQQRSSDNPSTEISVRLRGLDEEYNEGNWSLLWYIHDPSLPMATLLETIGPQYVSPGDDRSDKVTFTGLSPGKTYHIECRIQYYVDGERKTYWAYSDSPDADGDFTTNDPQRPAKFKWADGKTTKTSGQTFDITAGEWCDLLDNINSVRAYKGYSQFPQGNYTLSTYYNYFTYPATGQPFRYQHYNQALNAITGMLGYGYADNAVKQGDSVTADRINLLVEWLNGIT